jgi:signal transduction histidine kinase
MNTVALARWPLRMRVALAFLGATAAALFGLGVFVHVRVSAAFEERLKETIAFEADRLAAMPAEDQEAAVRSLGGDPFAQSLSAQGDVRISSALVAAPLLGSESVALESGYRDQQVRVFDDDAASVGEVVVEREASLLLVRRTGEGYLVVGTSREDTDDALAQVRAQLLVGVPLALALAGGLGYVVAGAGLRPIERLRSRAALISDRSAGERLPVPYAEDELRRLAVTLNAMLDRLDEGVERERRFLAEASHELRTPLTLMITEIELALERPRPPEELTSALQSVHDEARRLIVLAEDLLERMGADERGLPIEVKAVDLVALATSVVDRFRPVTGARAISVVAPAHLVILGDADRLDRALSNLVDNALRHGAGNVEVEIRATGDGSILTVIDAGEGFPQDTSPQGSGGGIGLTIVEEIVRAHGGTVDIQRVGGRTRVRVELASP